MEPLKNQTRVVSPKKAELSRQATLKKAAIAKEVEVIRKKIVADNEGDLSEGDVELLNAIDFTKDAEKRLVAKVPKEKRERTKKDIKRGMAEREKQLAATLDKPPVKEEDVPGPLDNYPVWPGNQKKTAARVPSRPPAHRREVEDPTVVVNISGLEVRYSKIPGWTPEEMADKKRDKENVKPEVTAEVVQPFTAQEDFNGESKGHRKLSFEEPLRDRFSDGSITTTIKRPEEISSISKRTPDTIENSSITNQKGSPERRPVPSKPNEREAALHHPQRAREDRPTPNYFERSDQAHLLGRHMSHRSRENQVNISEEPLKLNIKRQRPPSSHDSITESVVKRQKTGEIEIPKIIAESLKSVNDFHDRLRKCADFMPLTAHVFNTCLSVIAIHHPLLTYDNSLLRSAKACQNRIDSYGCHYTIGEFNKRGKKVYIGLTVFNDETKKIGYWKRISGDPEKEYLTN